MSTDLTQPVVVCREAVEADLPAVAAFYDKLDQLYRDTLQLPRSRTPRRALARHVPAHARAL